MSRIHPVTATPAPPTINIQSTLRTAPDLCKYVSLSLVLFGNNGNSYTVCALSDMCTVTYCTQYREGAWAKVVKKKKLGQQ